MQGSLAFPGKPTDREDMNRRNDESKIGTLIQTCRQHFQFQATGGDPITQATNWVVQIADPAIRRVKHHQQVLAGPIASSMQYFQALLETIPGPIVLKRSRYFDDPTVKALFASPDELDDILRCDPESNNLRKLGVTGKVVAMLTMRQQERTVFCHKQQGEMIVRDVRQQAVSFTDHRIVAPSANFDTTRTGMVNRGLEALAMVAKERIARLRANKAELLGKKEYLHGMAKILAVRSHRLGLFATRTPHNQEDIGKIEQMLAEVELELEALRQQIGLPEQSLTHLERVLRSPEEILTSHCQKFRLNWMGVRVEGELGSEGNDITLAELSLEGDKRSAVLVIYFLPTMSDSRP